jgi:hypothetical protein
MSDSGTPSLGPASGFDSLDCLNLVLEGPGDNTIRPSPPHLLPFLMAEREKIARWQALRKQAPPPEEQKGTDGSKTQDT